MFIFDGVSSREDPYYSTWNMMRKRCTSISLKDNNPTYEDVTCCEEWKRFSIFAAWMKQQNWEGMELDKDILVPGNKVYSPETCRFVPSYINVALVLPKTGKSGNPIGVHYEVHPRDSSKQLTKPYAARISCREIGRRRRLGRSSDPMLAHKMWQIAKAENIEAVVLNWSKEASYQYDVAVALLTRARKLRQDADLGIETLSL